MSDGHGSDLSPVASKKGRGAPTGIKALPTCSINNSFNWCLHVMPFVIDNVVNKKYDLTPKAKNGLNIREG